MLGERVEPQRREGIVPLNAGRAQADNGSIVIQVPGEVGEGE